MYRGNIRRTGNSNTSPIGGYIAVCPDQLNNKNKYIPNGYQLNPLYPNPFNPVATISYSMKNSDHVIIEVYDIRGRLVDNIFSNFQTSGNYSISWDASIFPSGIYFISMKVGTFNSTRKVLLLK